MYLQELDASRELFLQVNDDAKWYQVPPRCMAYALQEPFKKNCKDYKNTKYMHHWE